MDGTLGILGAGRMGEALLGGLLEAGTVAPGQVRCSVRRPEHAEALAERYGVAVEVGSAEVAEASDVVVLAVKPQAMGELLGEVDGHLRREQTVISVAAGVPIARVERFTPEGIAVIRAMLNTPVQVGEAMGVLAAGRHAGPEHLRLAEELLSTVGRVLVLPEEQLDAVTAVSGSGPAYVFLLAEAMVEAAVLQGLRREVAVELVTQTVAGAGRMLREGGASPTELREAVASPAGTTIAALRVLEEGGLRAAMMGAVEAARRRSEELGG